MVQWFVLCKQKTGKQLVVLPITSWRLGSQLYFEAFRFLLNFVGIFATDETTTMNFFLPFGGSCWVAALGCFLGFNKDMIEIYPKSLAAIAKTIMTHDYIPCRSSRGVDLLVC